MLNPTQIGLAVGVVSVCCLMAFGGGVIAGMWYKASEQNLPYASLATLPGEAAPAEPAPEEPLSDPRVTFYDTLKGKTPYTPLSSNAGSMGLTRTPVVPPSGSAPVTSASTLVAGAAPGGATESAKTSSPALPAASSATPKGATALSNSASGVTEPSPDAVVATTPVSPGITTAAALPAGASSAAGKAASTVTKTTVVPAKPTAGSARATKAATAAGTNTPAASAKETSAVTASKETRGATDSSARRQAETPSTAATAPRSGEKQYSVQAGSFRSPEQAERLRSQLAQKGYQARVQLFTSPNNESWYRVRVGNFSDRAVAGQTAQTLASREQLQTVVANDPH